MSNHKVALVPLATSEHQTPELFYKGRKADTGLFAESLIYYESVYVQAGNPEQFASFVSLVIQQGLAYDQLIELIKEGTLKFFNTVTIHPYVSRNPITDLPQADIIRNFIPIEEEAIKTPNYFETRFLDTKFLRNSFSNLTYLNQNAFDKFCQVAKENSLIFDGDAIASGLVDNAYDDVLNPEKYKLIVKSILVELYKINGLGEVPDFDVKIREMNSKNIEEIARNPNTIVIGREVNNFEYKIYEIDCEIPLTGLKNPEILNRVFKTLPLSCAGLSNLYIRSAGKLKCDIFLPTPMSQVVGNKLYEINDYELSADDLKNQNLVDSLERTVKFPDLHLLINQNKLDFGEVIKIRKKAKKFRQWLQQTNVDLHNDFQVFEAYLNQAAKESGFTKNVRRSLHLFGFITSTALGGLVGHSLSDSHLATTIGATAGAIATDFIKQSTRKISEKLFDYGAEIGKDWKPICFGNWYKEKIAGLLKDADKR